ncbi:hypothetical protein [Paraburkholderia sp.]|uniref:hypothetical protein n=1 Tax=Paraburkholderia sp. TaxID=1926495 RepID=UPI0039E27339
MKYTFRHTASIAVTVGMIYLFAFNHTPHGTECQSSKSPDGLYMAERCLLDRVPGGNSKYVGRLFNAQSGALLAQHTFATPVPIILWSSYEGKTVLFSVGDGGGDSTYIPIPPSRWDRFLAARPRL